MTATATATAIVENYLAAWNETDTAARQALITKVFTEDVEYVDPLAEVTGHEAMNGLIAAVQGQFPGMVLSLAGPVDAHHNVARFTWNLGPAGGEEIVVGFDVAVLGEDGRIRRVNGFLDKVPAGA
jgi:hypothetical protein